MKRWRTTLALALALLFLLGALSACGSSASKDTAAYSTQAEDSFDSAGTGGAANTDTSKSESLSSAEGDAGTLPGSVTDPASDPQAGANAKIIYTAQVYAQTLDYDAAIQALTKSVADCGGYVSSYNVSSGGYYADYYYDGSGNRSATYVLRIPSGRFQSFLSGLAEEFNVTEQDISSQDVTLQYVDTEARLNNLKAQETRLNELLEKATTIDQIVALEQQITDTRTEIDSLTSELRVLQDQVSYSTVTLSIYETTRYSTTPQTSFGQRIAEALANSWERLTEGAQSFVLFLSRNILQLVVLAAVLFCLVKFVWPKRRRLIRRKNRQKAPAQETSAQEAPAQETPAQTETRTDEKTGE